MPATPLTFPLRQIVVPVMTRGGRPLNFPVRHVFCVGKNYDEHAREMGGATNHTSPFFFLKPTGTVVTELGQHASPKATLRIGYPPLTESYHHEVELVVALGYPAGKTAVSSAAVQHDGDVRYVNINIEDAHDIIYGYAVGLDMTRRDLQLIAKNNRTPWDLAKGADEGTVVSPLMLASDLKKSHPEMFLLPDKNESHVMCGGRIFLNVNGSERQRSDVKCMVSPVAELIAHLSKYVSLQPGDLLFTGTPAGVGAVRRGDVIEAGIEGLGALEVTVV